VINTAYQSPVINHTGVARFTYPQPGLACVQIYFSTDGFRTSAIAHNSAPCIVLGASFTPVTPQRLLDTRSGGGAPMAPGSSLSLPLPAPMSTAAAVVLNVTVTQPTGKGVCGSTPCPRTAIVANLTVTNAKSAGYLSVYPFGQPRPVVSALNFTARQTVANLVTVGLGQNSFLVYNNAGSTVDVLVDQAGFYVSPA
jgi:hypothetical protein